MTSLAFDREWIDELTARRDRIVRAGALDKVRDLLASVSSHKQPLLPIPLAFDRATYDAIAWGAQKILSAQAKLVRHLCATRSRAEIVSQFRLHPTAARFVDWEELLAGRHAIHRFDVIPGADGFYFCELNRESAIGGQEIVDCLSVYSDALGWSLTEGWESPQRSLVTLMEGVCRREGLSRIVIVDWSSARGTGAFSYHFLRDHLARALPDVEVHLVYEDEYRDEWLAPAEGRRTLVYRGFLFCDMHDGGAFFGRVRDSGATILNTFETEILSNKAWFAMFHEPEHQAQLDADEIEAIRRHIPAAVRVTKGNLDSLLRNRGRWVFKGIHSFGGNAVFLGADHDEASLRARIEPDPEAWIAQELVRFEGLDLPYDASFERAPSQIVLGLYVIGGRVTGLNVRASRHSRVVNVAGGRAYWAWALPMVPEERARRLARIRATDAGAAE